MMRLDNPTRCGRGIRTEHPPAHKPQGRAERPWPPRGGDGVAVAAQDGSTKSGRRMMKVHAPPLWPP